MLSRMKIKQVNNVIWPPRVDQLEEEEEICELERAEKVKILNPILSDHIFLIRYQFVAPFLCQKY